MRQYVLCVGVNCSLYDFCGNKVGQKKPCKSKGSWFWPGWHSYLAAKHLS